MARQTQVRSYNTVHNKMQSTQSAFSSRFMVILALAIAGGVVFFSARFYFAEKNGTGSNDTSLVSGSEAASDGSSSTGSTSAGVSSSSGTSSSQGGSTGAGTAKNSGSGQSSSNTADAGSSTPANGCTAPSAPEAACATFRSIEAKGLDGNIYVTTSFPRIPDTAAFIVDDGSWGQSSDSSATVKMSAFYNGIVDRVLLQLTLKGSNWVVSGFTQQ